MNFHSNCKESPLPMQGSRKFLELEVEKFSLLRTPSLSKEEKKDVLQFLLTMEEKYHEEGELKYHRVCGGGAVILKDGEIFCANCGKLSSDPTPPPAMMTCAHRPEKS